MERLADKLQKIINEQDFCFTHEEIKIVNKALKRLDTYEDAEEQGLLLRLPCKVGTIVYTVKYYFDCKFGYNCPLGYAEGKNNCDKGLSCEHEYKKFFVGEKIFDASITDDIGKTIFLTKEEAEQTLADMKGV